MDEQTKGWFKDNWAWVLGVVIIVVVILFIISSASAGAGAGAGAGATVRTERYHDSNQDGYELGRGLGGRGPRLFEVVHDYPYHPYHPYYFDYDVQDQYW